MLSKNNSATAIAFWIFTISTSIFVTVPILIQNGTFMDAMLYTCVANNMAQGIGSLWSPQFSEINLAISGLNGFYEQPPLVFFIQSVFFKVFGHSLYVEKFYTFLAMLLTAYLIAFLWKQVSKNDTETKQLSWLPVFLWITVSVVFWSFSKNMIENTQGIFVLLSVIVSYNNFTREKPSIGLWIISGFFIFLASFSKGLPGLFPVTVPFIFWLCYRKGSFANAIVYSVILVLVPTITYAVLLQFPESKASLYNYFFDRLLYRVNNNYVVENRLYTILNIIMEMTPQLIIGIIFTALGYFSMNNKKMFPVPKHALFFLLVGLAGTLPFSLTKVQKTFYAIPAIPFMALSIAYFISPVVKFYIAKINTASKGYKLFFSFCLLFFVVACTVSLAQKDKTERDEARIHDTKLVGSVVPSYTTISTHHTLWGQDWSLQGYLMRYFNISMDPNTLRKYHMLEKNDSSNVPEGYKKVALSTQQFDLYMRDE